jgi:hypothetical protein
MSFFNKKIISGKIFFLFPLFVALYPIIFYYSTNVQEVLITQLFIPVTVAIVFTLLIWGVLFFLLKDIAKAGFLTTIFLIFFFTYGMLFDFIASLGCLPVKHWHVLPVVLVFFGYLVYFVNSIEHHEIFINIAKISMAVFTVLIILCMINIIPVELKKIEYAADKDISSVTYTVSDNTSGYPDIYYIILDEYASSATIHDVWGYDNSEFTTYLKNQEFFIAENSSVRYPLTELSIDTSLNMEYPGPEITHEGIRKVIRDNTLEQYLNHPMIDEYRRIQHNNVVKYLKGKNYKIIVLDGFYSAKPAIGLMDADVHYNYILENKVLLIDDFSFMLIESSMLRPFDYLFQMDKITNSKDMSRYSTQYILNKIEDIPQIAGPKFVFVHIMVPHVPFIFTETGGRVNPANAYNWNDKKYYLDQYIYITRKISDSINTIQSESEQPPVIIIQSDHGPRGLFALNNEQNPGISMDDMHKIFNAYYLPDGGNVSVYQNISPVNTFRVIFNYYFDDDYALLEDE